MEQQTFTGNFFDANDSTLSLHIAAYENAIDATAADSFIHGPDLNKQWENAKQFFIGSKAIIQNPFELPRQQKEDQSNKPEVMQFKASQKLLNPNVASPLPKTNAPEHYNPANVMRRLNLGIPKRGMTENVTSFEHDIASKVKGTVFRSDLLINVNNVTDLILHPEKMFEDLCFAYEGFDENDCGYSDEYISEEGEEEDPSYSDTEAKTKDRKFLEQKYPQETWIEIIEKYNTTKFTSIQHNYRKLKDRHEILRMKQYLTTGGSTFHKYEKIDEFVINEFIKWKQDFQIVHERDLVDAAMSAADSLGMENFKASEFWIRSFKRRHRIVSRKITNFIATKDLAQEESIQDRIVSFRDEFSKLIRDRPLNGVYNTDQTGIQLEMISKRTLETQGVKKVKAVAQRLNALTHSFTAQPVISAAGKLMLPVYIVFYETKRPNCFDEDLQDFKYIKAASSTSGNMSSVLVKDWFDTVFMPQAMDDSLLLIDSWTGYLKVFQNQPNLNYKIIPPKTTGELQPLDVFFNRQLKAFYRILSDKIRRRHATFDVSNRKGIGTLLNLTFSQMASPVFSDMIKFAWYKSGYLSERPHLF
uniref:HTH CENPB-type domain-containing protein n=1 Tax=Panagrolaimus superbus TaxID=310955 RepID=A0A914YV56_9BILA